MEKIDRAIALSEKRTALLKEYKQAIAEENANYIVERLDDRQHVLTDKKIAVFCGTRAEIEKYIAKRKLQKVYYREG